MIYIAFFAVGCVALMAISYGTVVTFLVRQHARERNLMLNQLLHLAGRTWQPPPVGEPDEAFNPDELLDERFTTAPTQLPDY